MMKICPRCAGTFAGGSFCPGCGIGQPLIDMSSDEARPFLQHPDMRRAVAAHYIERSGMVRTALGSLVGIFGGLFILRYAVGADGPLGRALFVALSAAWMFFFAGGAILNARRRAKATNDGTPEYVCEGEDEPVEKFRPPPRRGLRWMTW
jgi:hypothetical protein